MKKKKKKKQNSLKKCIGNRFGVLFGKVKEPLGSATLLEEVGH